MLKFLVITLILCQGICTRCSDTSMPMFFGPMGSADVNDSVVEIPGIKGQYFYSPRQTIIINVPSDKLNAPSGWKWPTNLGNFGMTRFRTDYAASAGGVEAHKVHRHKLSWVMARQICIEEGGHLADIKSTEEMYAIKTLMIASKIDVAWVGFHDIFQEGNWISVLDESLAGMNWSPWSTKVANNPNNMGGNENCAVFTSSQDGLNDEKCITAYPFICKMRA